MRKTISRSELLRFAKLAPDVIKIRLVDHNDSLSLHLKWKDISGTIESSHSIWQESTKVKLDQKSYDIIMDKIKREIKNVISKFGKDQCDFLINKFELSEVYKEIYEDKNIMYKVKYKFVRRIDEHSVTKSLSFSLL